MEKLLTLYEQIDIIIRQSGHSQFVLDDRLIIMLY